MGLANGGRVVGDLLSVSGELGIYAVEWVGQDADVMLSRQRVVRRQVHQVVDAGLFGLSFWLAHLLRSNWEIQVFGGAAQIEPFAEYLSLYLFLIPFAPLLLESQGFYDRHLVELRRHTAWSLAKACVLVAVGLVLVTFLFRLKPARSVVIMFAGISFAVIFLKEEGLRWWRRTVFGKRFLQKRVILMGTAEETAELGRELAARARDGIGVVAEFNLNTQPVERLVDLLHEHSANGVIMCAQHNYFAQAEKAIEVCELEGVEVWLLADFFRTQISRVSLDDFHGRPTLVFRSTPEDSWQSVAKQVIDTVGAAVLLVLVSPLLAAVALAIRLSSPGPVIFKQKRSGLNGHPFTMVKFRSMVTDAEQRQQEIAGLNEMGGPVFKVTHDPRVTPIGRWLRKYSLDELPQLWNVLRGEMSLVGPRPLPVDEVRRIYDLAHRRRLSVKPGLTCLWQVSGRNNVKDFDEWVRLDLEYIDNWSLWLDFKILLRTIPVVVLGTGAK